MKLHHRISVKKLKIKKKPRFVHHANANRLLM